MAINPTTKGVHHIALRCTDMEATTKFYRDVLGFTLALDSPDIIGFLAGNIILAFKKANAQKGEEVLHLSTLASTILPWLANRRKNYNVLQKN